MVMAQQTALSHRRRETRIETPECFYAVAVKHSGSNEKVAEGRFKEKAGKRRPLEYFKIRRWKRRKFLQVPIIFRQCRPNGLNNQGGKTMTTGQEENIFAV